MFETNELITLILGTGIAGFFCVYRPRIQSWPGGRWLCAAYLSTLAGWILTVAEGVWMPELLNTLEHLSYGLAGQLLFWTVLRGGDEQR